MITIIGTSHISPESIRTIRDTIENEKPDCVAVELDMNRYISMKSGEMGRPPGLFLKIFSWMQKKLGKSTGIFPGQEMMTAIEFSRKNKIPVYLIDQNISVTAGELRRIPTLEKIKLILLTLFAFSGEKIDLSKVPPEKVIKDAMKYMRKNFPKMYKVLVTKRNKYMASAVLELTKDHKNILVVVGAGHVDGLKKLLKGRKVKTIL